jgi:hypothetical protein
VANLEIEGARLGQLNEAPLDQFGEGARSGVFGKAALSGSVANGKGYEPVVPSVVPQGDVNIERPRLGAEGEPGCGFQDVSWEHDEWLGPSGPALLVVSRHG